MDLEVVTDGNNDKTEQNQEYEHNKSTRDRT